MSQKSTLSFSGVTGKLRTILEKLSGVVVVGCATTSEALTYGALATVAENDTATATIALAGGAVATVESCS
jgi:hypothetical protein